MIYYKFTINYTQVWLGFRVCRVEGLSLAISSRLMHTFDDSSEAVSPLFGATTTTETTQFSDSLITDNAHAAEFDVDFVMCARPSEKQPKMVPVHYTYRCSGALHCVLVCATQASRAILPFCRRRFQL